MLNHKKTSADRSGSLFAIIDERISPACEAALIKEGYELIKLPPDERLGKAVSSHTDMLLFRHGRTLIGSRVYFEKHAELFDTLRERLTDLDIRLSDEEQTSEYPRDAIFNALVIGNRLFCKIDSVSREILRYADENGMKVINVNQGYPACATLAINDSLAVTADLGMARALEAEGICVLSVENTKKIKLKPFEYGFIGGTAGINESRVYFFGNVASLPYRDALEKSLRSHGCEAISLDEESDFLSDLGGIILIATDSTGSSTSPTIPNNE